MNSIRRSLVVDGSVALSVMDTTELVRDGIRIHGVYGDEASLFGGLLTFTAYLGTQLKSERGSVSVSVKFLSGAAISCSSDAALHVRGCIDGDTSALDGATVTVISDDGYGERPYLGVCLFEGNDLSENLENYFLQSVQVATLVRIHCVTEGDACVSAGGIIASCMPGGREDAAMECYDVLSCIDDLPAEIGKGCGYFADTYFPGEYLETDEPVYRCNCSRERVWSVIEGLGRGQIFEMLVEDPEIKVKCQYCGSEYVFTKDEVIRLLNR
ncbi:MAG: Hsp33 family molecular chaperone HslO [Clostridia bacterium]|nr:Hsp33 family molecular chaperone HslO [Clostridia bacterium]